MICTLESHRVGAVRDLCELRLAMRTLAIVARIASKDPVLVPCRHLVLFWEILVEQAEFLNGHAFASEPCRDIGDGAVHGLQPAPLARLLVAAHLIWNLP